MSVADQSLSDGIRIAQNGFGRGVKCVAIGIRRQSLQLGFAESDAFRQSAGSACAIGAGMAERYFEIGEFFELLGHTPLLYHR